MSPPSSSRCQQTVIDFDWDWDFDMEPGSATQTVKTGTDDLGIKQNRTLESGHLQARQLPEMRPVEETQLVRLN